mmetsp:Transcript_51997/g.167702  ORF Transcript_51997/g.167702 Transcript_51997/m.167702 type:complete len:242 (-) Transcript_51997:15-740(-)
MRRTTRQISRSRHAPSAPSFGVHGTARPSSASSNSTPPSANGEPPSRVAAPSSAQFSVMGTCPRTTGSCQKPKGSTTVCDDVGRNAESGKLKRVSHFSAGPTRSQWPSVCCRCALRSAAGSGVGLGSSTPFSIMRTMLISPAAAAGSVTLSFLPGVAPGGSRTVRFWFEFVTKLRRSPGAAPCGTSMNITRPRLSSLDRREPAWRGAGAEPPRERAAAVWGRRRVRATAARVRRPSAHPSG